MFGDSMFDEEDRLRRAETGQDQNDPTAADERLRRRQAITQLLREVGGV
jgi:hypothetical protein